MRVWREQCETWLRKKNEKWERLIDFCLEFDLVIEVSLFQHKDIQKLTWKAPDGKTVNQNGH